MKPRVPKPDQDVPTMSFDRLREEVLRLRAGIREHRDAKGDDRCWLDDIKLYGLLPDDVAAITTLPPREQFLRSCQKFYDTRQCPHALKLHEW